MKPELKFFLGKEKVAYPLSYTYIGVMFTWLLFYLQDMQPLVLLTDNVHIYNSKCHEPQSLEP